VRPYFIKEVQALIGEAHCIPEGGTEAESLMGMAQSLLEIEDVSGYDFLACPVGTGGTAMGLALGLCHYFPRTPTKVLALSALRGYQSLPHESLSAANAFGGQDFTDTLLKRVCFIPESAGRGYGKTDESVLNFMHHWQENTGIPLDYVYTGKALRWIVEKLAQHSDSKPPKILFFHTGGYQTAGLKRISPPGTLSFSLNPHREYVISKG
jgi:1-aminocyclopropane-1-carboxylate deaminase